MKRIALLLLLAATAQAGIPMRPALSTEVNQWSYVAKTNSGSISANTLVGATYCIRDIYAAGIRTNLLRANLFSGADFVHNSAASSTNMGAVQVPIIADSGTRLDANSYPTTGWIYTERGSSGGLAGGTNSPVLHTGLVPNTVPMSLGSVHVGAYVRTALNETSFAMGGEDNGGAFSILGITGPHTIGACHAYLFDTSDVGIPTDSAGVGWFSASRTSTTLKKWYKNGSPVATNTVSNAGDAVPSPDIVIFGFQLGVNGVISQQCTKSMGAYTIAYGLTDAQEAALYTAIQRFETWMSRQVP